MDQRARELLEKKLTEKISFDSEILSTYDHDIAEIPPLVMNLIDNVPEAVVIARSVEDVGETLAIAGKFRIPVTPRGQASSGYGGSIPTRRGILLDLAEMTRIIGVDEENLLVDVEPGVVWKELSHELNKVGLDNCIVPTSAPSSTVGGWFAMGGVGLGSLLYGSIQDVVLEIDVVGLDGRVRTLAGEDLALHYQACGILGVITRLRLQCRKAEEMRPQAVALPDAGAVEGFAMAARDELRPYTIILHSPGYVRMRKDMDEEESVPENSFLAIVVLSEGSANGARLAEIAARNKGVILDEAVAKHSWNDRFYPMRIKKLGPSVLVSEFYLPVDNFREVWKGIEDDLSRELLGLEALIIHDGKMAVLVYILDNANRFLYQLRMAKALRPIRVAERYGGSIYTAGLWFASSSRRIFGQEKYSALMGEKRRIDPAGLLNPGKIIAPRMKFLPFVNVSSLIDLASRITSPLSKALVYKRSSRERMDN
jgi:FAD/FMN-containing dehydrogenase